MNTPFPKPKWLFVPLIAGLGLALVILSLSATMPVAGVGPPTPLALPPANTPSQAQELIPIPLSKQGATLDGWCDTETEYADAASFEFSDAFGVTATLFLKHDGADLYACLFGAVGSRADRFAGLYLDPDNGRHELPQADDLALQIEILTGTQRSLRGSGGPSGYVSTTLSGWSAVATTGNADVAEYRVPLSLTGGLCGLPFGLSGRHQSLKSTDDDFGWPSDSQFDRPDTWQPVSLLNGPCEIPVEYYRRASDLLQDTRGSSLAPGWESAQLDPAARPLFRPDVEGVAYYEFRVFTPSLNLPGQGIDQSNPAGFIIVSTGEHDFPIPHWDALGQAPTYELAQLAQEADKNAAKFYKLDALAYAAEDEFGELAATLGSPLVQLSGQDPDWLDQPQELSQASWTLDQQPANDDNASDISGTLTLTGPISSSLQLVAWDSWADLKLGYTDAYSLVAESLRRQASRDWELEALWREYGIVLQKGDVYTLSLLEAGPAVSLVGVGASSVQTETVSQGALLPAIQLTVISSTPGVGLPFSLTLDYPSSPTETIQFVIMAPPESDYTIWLPTVMHNQSPQTSIQSREIRAAQEEWGPWRFYWAGINADQRLYEQIESGTPPNNTSCWSGCGGTAWAMLFGWADRQADLGNPYWSSRWGLYRQNGGYGTNAVAPRRMDDGVRNVSWEIRSRIGTFCLGSSGATFPWDMPNAAGYLSGRTGTRLAAHWNSAGFHSDDLRVHAQHTIVNQGTPAIIGTGWLNHYPLAYGYAWRSRTVTSCFFWECWENVEYNRAFYVNQGWGGRDNGWVSAGTWFFGSIYP